MKKLLLKYSFYILFLMLTAMPQHGFALSEFYYEKAEDIKNQSSLDQSPAKQRLSFNALLGYGHLISRTSESIGEGGFTPGASIEYNYQFKSKKPTYSWGLVVGLDWLSYSNKYVWKDQKYDRSMIDNNGVDYLLFQQMKLSERTSAHYIGIPIMARFDLHSKSRSWFSEYSWLNAYIALGVNVGFNVKEKTEYSGSIYRYAYFPSYDLTVDESEVLPLGHQELKASGNTLGLNLSLVTQIGCEFRLSELIGLNLSVNGNYGLINLQKKSNPLVSYEPYQGLANSDFLKSINTYFVGGKVGIIFYLK